MLQPAIIRKKVERNAKRSTEIVESTYQFSSEIGNKPKMGHAVYAVSISINVCWMIARNEARRAIWCMKSGFSSRLENGRSTTQGVDFAILKITPEYAQLFDPVEISILVAGIAEINIRPRSGNR